ncbi:MAG: hypothetical protein KJ964_04900 [Verrucomicrobia bacterium]|nr:hypothetical protein [Verrucomicrobiota bacterium]MBU1736140.1 hypothetical protein [Verrucomicrobiota bacterium]MBU1856195.1 hypothetical protein [Verrucomicrobiota bacterium]
MKPVRDMSRLELAGLVSTEFQKNGINVVLSGGSCVSIYSEEKYVSMDLDFVNVAFTKRDRIRKVMESLGFHEEKRYFRHPNTDLLVEFPPGPLGVGQEPVKRIIELQTGSGILRIISPTDCVKDRLAWYYHDGDTECLRQAILVANHCAIDLKEIEQWSEVESKSHEFKHIKGQLQRKKAQPRAQRYP